jgi:hypothetical protein
MDDWVTIADAAKISGYHPERIRELARERRIVSRKWGQAYQISRESLLQYIDDAIKGKDKRFGPKNKFPKT